MSKLTHKFFGELDLEKGLDDGFGANLGDGIIVLWEEEINDINTTLWYSQDAELSTELLDVFESFLNNFEEHNKRAREALVEYLEENDDYITCHRDEFEMDVPDNAPDFVESMCVTNIGLWADGENIIIVDYMIEPDESDEILAVKFDENLEIIDIAWES